MRMLYDWLVSEGLTLRQILKRLNFGPGFRDGPAALVVLDGPPCSCRPGLYRHGLCEPIRVSRGSGGIHVDPFASHNYSSPLIVLAIPMVLLFAQAGPPKNDVATEAKFKVTVQQMELPAKGKEKDAAHLTVTSGTDTIDIYLCPKASSTTWALLSPGRQSHITGSEIKQDGSDLILAREVVKGTDTLMRRDDKGKPIWNWHK